MSGALKGAFTDLLVAHDPTNPAGRASVMLDGTVRAWEVGIVDARYEVRRAKRYGVIGDGTSHPLSERYATLVAAQAVYPHATALTNEIDWCGLTAGMISLNAGGGGILEVDAGTYMMSDWLTALSNVAVEGPGADQIAWIKGNFAAPKNRIVTSPSGVQQKNVAFRHIGVDRTHPNSQHGALFGGIDGLTLDDFCVLGPAVPTNTSGALGISPFDEFAGIQSKNVRLTNIRIKYSNNFGIAFGNVSVVNGGNWQFENCYRELVGFEGWCSNPIGNPTGVENVNVHGVVAKFTQNSYHDGGSIGPFILVGGSGSGGFARRIRLTGVVGEGLDTAVAGQAFVGIQVLGAPSLAAEEIYIQATLKNCNGQAVAIGASGYITKHVTVDVDAYDCNLGNNVSPFGSIVGLRNATYCTVNVRGYGTHHTHIVEETSTSDHNTISYVGDTGTVAAVTLVGANSVSSGPAAFQSVGPGVVRLGTVTIPNGGSYTFAARGVNNRGFYVLADNYGTGTGALFFANGAAAPTSVFHGGSVVFAATDTGTPNAVTVFPASASQITVVNRLGSDRNFTLFSVATQ